MVITQAAQLPLAGLLLALPSLAATGLLETAAGVFPPMRKGFYGLRATLLTGVFLASLREPRTATRVRPADLGRVLGLDRAPEVKDDPAQAHRARPPRPGRGGGARWLACPGPRPLLRLGQGGRRAS